MALVDSLLSAMVRADGDALVMHVGERPIVVSGSRTVDLSNHGMNLGAMVGMLGQLLSLDAQALLRELGAVEHELPSRESDRFSVVAARSGDDIWIEIRRRRESLASAAASEAAALPAADEPVYDDADVEAADRDAEERAADSADRAVEEHAVDGADRDADERAADRPDEPAVDTEASGAAADGPEGVVEAASVPEPAEDITVPAHSHLEVVDDQLEERVDVPVGAADSVPMSSAAEDDVDVIAISTAATSDEIEGLPLVAPVQGSVEEHAADPEQATAQEPVQDEALHVPDEAVAEESRQELAEPPPVEDEPAVIAHAQDTAEAAAPIAAVAAASDAVEHEVQLPAEATAVPILASAAAALHPVSTLASGLPMDAARHQGHSAGGPPPESVEPVTSSEPASPAVTQEDPGARGPDAPVTRTVRIEVPDRASSTRAAGIDRLLRAADALGASELFLVSQSRPYVRAGGNVRPLQDEPVLHGSDIEALIADVTPEPWRDAVRRGDPADWLIEVPDIGRVRCATFRDHRGPGANFHFSFLRAASADDLQLSAETRRLATEPDGLVLVTGAAGSDMAAIVSAFVDLLNQQRADYIITLEPQVRTLHVNREALVSQREVGSDPARAAAAALAALREQPDVLVIESLNSTELAQLAIDAAAQNRLVIASIEAPSAALAVQRLVEMVSAEQRAHARSQLSRCFRGAVAQLMLRKSSGGKIAARELLTSTRAVTGLLADGELPRLAEQLESAAASSLAPIADTVVEYVRSGVVDVREAVRKAPDASRLLDRLKAAGADLGVVDGWN